MNHPAILTPLARRELRQALQTIASNNPEAARRLNAAVAAAAGRLGSNPALGRTQPYLPPRFRFWSLTRFGYLLVYDTTTVPVQIIRIVHSARDLPRLLTHTPD